MKLPRLTLFACAGALSSLSVAPSAWAFWTDGSGNYGLRGSTETAPGFAKDGGTFQAIEQTFRLTGEVRANDQLSLFLEMRLFDKPRQAYLGDTAEPKDCPDARQGKSADPAHPCAGTHQNSGEPAYQSYTPKITEAYVRYAFDYCIVDAGRRPRDWGLGMFLDSGRKPFDTDASIFDGVTCNVNIQKTQTLGFSVGYDKLAETGAIVDRTQDAYIQRQGRTFGANDPADDLDQYFFTIQYDDRKVNAGATFTKQVGVYFAQVNGADYKTKDDGNGHSYEVGGDGSDIKFLDLFTGFYVGDFAWKNEVLFRMGKSGDPSWQDLGGAAADNGTPAINKLDSIGFAGNFEWTMSHSGAPLGPADFNKGDARRHLLFLNYAYAPGSSEGYKDDQTYVDANGKVVSDQNLSRSHNSNNTGRASSKVTAMEFNRNFKPALLLFNARPEADRMIVDGAFNPGRMVNATLFAMGYRYESMENGNFESKLITANLNSTPPGVLKDYYARPEVVAKDNGDRPAGYFGRSLGYELDLTYDYKIGRDADLGVAVAAALPGKAWQTNVNSTPSNDFLLQTFAAWNF